MAALATADRLAERVYRAPGAPGGVAAAELKTLPVPLQMLVMEAWFRAKFQPAPQHPAGAERDLELELTGEFGGIVAGESVAALARALSAEARVWVTEASADPRFQRPETAQEVILARLENVEKALAKLRPAHGGIGHNNPPDGPLTPEEHTEASTAIAELREEASAARPDTSRVQRARQVLAKVAEAVGRWLWKRAEIVIDEFLKEVGKKAAHPAVVAFGALIAFDGWQKLMALLDAIQRWIGSLG
ncbi:MAG: hypothetical protein ACK530_15570 [Alphaproteobacteria bacterium]